MTVRRARRFARAVDADRDVQEQPAVDDAMRQLVAVVDRLRTTEFDGAPAPEFTSRLRERLLAAAAAAATAPTDVLPRIAPEGGASGSPTRPSRPRRHRVRPTGVPVLARLGSPRVAVLAGALSALVALAGATVVASHRALPGDRLYSLKRTTEDVELAFARGDEAKARRHLDFAQNRAGELADFVSRERPLRLDDGEVTLVLSALADMDGETRQGARMLTTYAVGRTQDGPLADLAAWAGDQRALLRPVLDRLTGPAADRAKRSVALVDQVRQRVAALRTQLSCSCLTHGHADDLGPLPCLPCDAPAAGEQAATNPPLERTGGAPGTVPGAGPSGGAGSATPAPTGAGGTPGGTPSPSPSGVLPTLPTDSGSPTDSGGLLPPLLPSGLPLLPTVPDLLPNVLGN